MQTTCSRCGLFHPSDIGCPVSGLLGSSVTGARRPGELIAGRYRVDRMLHHGGMSTVYLANDAVLDNRAVAIKELRPGQDATPDEVREAEAWFARESALLSMLRHPLIPAFYSVFRDEDRSYIVQEYVPGVNLEEQVAQEGPVAEQTAVEWGIALCDLLTYLHTQPEPVIFRDLKPANVLIRAPWSDRDRRLAVVDFGIARQFQNGAVGTVIGTPGYAPPEQYQGLATPQSDIYALGATLHRMVTGYDPEHPGAEQPLFSFPPARRLTPALSPRMEEILARATALNPADRFASALEFRAALKGLATRRLRAAPSRSSSSGRHAVMMLAAVLLLPLMLTQMLRIAQIPLQNGFYAEQATGSDPWPPNQQYAMGAFNDGTDTDGAQFACTPPASADEVDVSPTVCGPDGTWWQIDGAGQITHILASGEIVPYAAIGQAPGSPELVSMSPLRSHCNCVWVVWGDTQARLNAGGDISYQTLPASVLKPVASGLLQP
ncbi:MAG TPA: serine/threonine-protein kinase [Chloroflexota bacterium]|nr:serine/threonine-protein kinase [Chloroflexota bacterium]